MEYNYHIVAVRIVKYWDKFLYMSSCAHQQRTTNIAINYLAKSCYADQHIKYVWHYLREKTVRDLQFLGNDGQLDRVCIEGDDPRHASDEQVDEP
jgi:hypothetical protein